MTQPLPIKPIGSDKSGIGKWSIRLLGISVLGNFIISVETMSESFQFLSTSYLILIFSTCIILLKQKSITITKRATTTYIWKMILIFGAPLIYLVGLCTGLIQGYPVKHVLANFPQIALFPCTYIVGTYLAKVFTLKELCKRVSWFVSVLSCLVIVKGGYALITTKVVYNITAYRQSYSPELYLLFPVIAALIYKALLAPQDLKVDYMFKSFMGHLARSRLGALALSLIILASCNLVMGSKAVLIVTAVLMLVFIVSGVVYLTTEKKKSMWITTLALLIATIIGIYYLRTSQLVDIMKSTLEYGYGLVSELFNTTDQSPYGITEIDAYINDPRIESQVATIQDLSIFGNGLGASLPIIRSYYKPFLAEHLYLNIIHKFGIFALPLIMVYLIPLYRSFVLLLSSKYSSRYYGSILCGLTLPFITGMYTPIILGPCFLIAMVLITFILAKQESVNQLYI